MVVGAIATGWGDLDFDLIGYTLAIVSCCLQAIYLVLASHNSDLGLDTFCMSRFEILCEPAGGGEVGGSWRSFLVLGEGVLAFLYMIRKFTQNRTCANALACIVDPHPSIHSKSA